MQHKSIILFEKYAYILCEFLCKHLWWVFNRGPIEPKFDSISYLIYFSRLLTRFRYLWFLTFFIIFLETLLLTSLRKSFSISFFAVVFSLVFNMIQDFIKQLCSNLIVWCIFSNFEPCFNAWFRVLIFHVYYISRFFIIFGTTFSTFPIFCLLKMAVRYVFVQLFWILPHWLLKCTLVYPFIPVDLFFQG